MSDPNQFSSRSRNRGRAWGASADERFADVEPSRECEHGSDTATTRGSSHPDRSAQVQRIRFNDGSDSMGPRDRADRVNSILCALDDGVLKLQNLVILAAYERLTETNQYPEIALGILQIGLHTSRKP